MGPRSSIRRIRLGTARRAAACAALAALAVVAPSAFSGSGLFADAGMPAGEDASVAPDHHPQRNTIFPDGLRAGRPMALPASTVIMPDATGGSAPTRESSLPAIAICIDDLGGNLIGTATAISLPENVTLAFLPYAAATPALAEQSVQLGHEVLAHVPMEPIGPSDPGPMTLKVGASDNVARLAWALARVPGISGINNHEGSKFSGDAASLIPVAKALSERHLFFFDSRTIGGSQIVRVSHGQGVESAGRDVFLDNVVTDAAVKARLNELVLKAKKTGIAIAIGHPHDVTLRVLAAWLADDHGVRLVPVSEAIRMKTERASRIAAR